MLRERILRNPEKKTRPAGPSAGSVQTNPKDGQRYAWIPPGKFTMGCSPGDSECHENEKPVHPGGDTAGGLPTSGIRIAFIELEFVLNCSGLRGPANLIPSSPHVLDFSVGLSDANSQRELAV